MKTQRPEKQKQQWFKDYDALVVEGNPAAAGKIDWDTATYLYNTGLTPAAAAAKTLETGE